MKKIRLLCIISLLFVGNDVVGATNECISPVGIFELSSSISICPGNYTDVKFIINGKEDINLTTSGKILLNVPRGEKGIEILDSKNISISGFVFSGYGQHIYIENSEKINIEENGFFGLEGEDENKILEMMEDFLQKDNFLEKKLSTFPKIKSISSRNLNQIAFSLPRKANSLLNQIKMFLETFSLPEDPGNENLGEAGVVAQNCNHLIISNNFSLRQDSPIHFTSVNGLSINDNWIFESGAKSLTINMLGTGYIKNNLLVPWLDAGGFACENESCELEVDGNIVLIPKLYSFISGELFYFPGWKNGWYDVHDNWFLNLTPWVEDNTINTDTADNPDGWPTRGHIFEGGKGILRNNVHLFFDTGANINSGSSTTIENNIFLLHNSGVCMWYGGSNSSLVKNNFFFGCEVGLKIEDSLNPQFENNIIVEYGQTAIRMTNTTEAFFQNNHISYGPTGLHAMGETSAFFKGGSFSYCGIAVEGTSEELENIIFEDVIFKNNGIDFNSSQ